MGGGGISIPQRQLGPELGQLNQAFWKNIFPSYSRFLGQSPLLTAGQPTVQNTLTTGGALTPEQNTQVEQDTGAQLSAAGMRHTNPGIFAIELNKDQYRQGRFNQALQQAIGLQGAQTGNFMNLYGPALGFGQDVFSSNQNAQAAANIANANKSAGLGSGLMSSLASVGSAAAMAGIMFSDKRLKKNVRDTGETTEEGIPIKTFEYKHRFKGVMADDVEKVRPDAVVEHPSGFKMVNYNRIKAPFQFMALGGEVKDEVEKLHKVPPFIMLPIMGNPALDQYFKHVGFEELQEGGEVMGRWQRWGKTPTEANIHFRRATRAKRRRAEEMKRQEPSEEMMPSDADHYRMQKGGEIDTDTVPVMATPGEFMHNTGSVELFGRDFHNWMNEAGKRFMQMQGGGGSGKKKSRGRPMLHMQGGGWVEPTPIPQAEKFENIDPGIYSALSMTLGPNFGSPGFLPPGGGFAPFGPTMLPTNWTNYSGVGWVPNALPAAIGTPGSDPFAPGMPHTQHATSGHFSGQ